MRRGRRRRCPGLALRVRGPLPAQDLHGGRNRRLPGPQPGAGTGRPVRRQGSGDQGIRRTRHGVSLARDGGDEGWPAATPSSQRGTRRASAAAGLARVVVVAVAHRLPRHGRRGGRLPTGRVRVGAMTRRHDPARLWMIGALGGALAIAAEILADRGTGVDGIGQAVRYTARWSFVFFWPSYVGGALPLGLAFAAALQVHIGLVIWLGVVIGQIPLSGGLLWFFIAALSSTYLLALLSFGIGTRALGRLWRPVLFIATTYILIAFGWDFVQGALDTNVRSWRHAAE